MYRSFIEPIWLDNFINNNKLELPKETLFRFNNILRIKKDEQIAIFDGKGRQVEGILHNNSFASFKIVKEEPKSPKIILLQAALEESKISETIKRTTEFGIDEIIIFPADFSQSFSINKINKKITRLEEIIKDASRQSGRFYIPSFKIINNLETFFNKLPNKYLGIFGDVEQKNILSNLLMQENNQGLQEIIIIVGPEGGLSKKEKLLCESHNFKGVIWSPFVLRSELASLAALSIVNAYLKIA